MFKQLFSIFYYILIPITFLHYEIFQPILLFFIYKGIKMSFENTSSVITQCRLARHLLLGFRFL